MDHEAYQMKKNRFKYAFTMTKTEALNKGLLTCECGHPENNHHDFGTRSCARCDCQSFNEMSTVGTFMRYHDEV